MGSGPGHHERREHVLDAAGGGRRRGSRRDRAGARDARGFDVDVPGGGGRGGDAKGELSGRGEADAGTASGVDASAAANGTRDDGDDEYGHHGRTRRKRIQ